MKSVGEVMAIGRTFKEAFLKALRSLETGKVLTSDNIDKSLIRQKLITPNAERIPYLLQALIDGSTIQELVDLTRIDPWFLHEMKEIADTIHEISAFTLETLPKELLREAKRSGFSDTRLARILRVTPAQISALRLKEGIVPVYKRVDTCAAEFESHTPYLYSTYEDEDEAEPTNQKKVMILGKWAESNRPGHRI